MFGVDDRIASLSDGGSVLVVLLVALLLGLRHATDPDHIAAVTTLVASTRERAARRAAQLGAWWGLGHALTLIVFGVPIVLFERYLPAPLERRGRDRCRGADRVPRGTAPDPLAQRLFPCAHARAPAARARPPPPRPHPARRVHDRA